jgi:hypothetical protein
LEQIRTRLERRSERSGHDCGAGEDGVWQAAFAEIGDDERFDSHLF